MAKDIADPKQSKNEIVYWIKRNNFVISSNIDRTRDKLKASSDEANDVVISRKCISENSDCILTKDNLQR